MCEVLIRKHDKDANHLKGDIIFIAPDGHSWSRRESRDVWIKEGLSPEEYPDDFMVVKIPYISVEDFKHNMTLIKGPALENTHNLNISKLPNSQRKKLEETDKLDLSSLDAIVYSSVRKSLEQKEKEAYEKTTKFSLNNAERTAVKHLIRDA